jgi:hypothetical protein
MTKKKEIKIGQKYYYALAPDHDDKFIVKEKLDQVHYEVVSTLYPDGIKFMVEGKELFKKKDHKFEMAKLAWKLNNRDIDGKDLITLISMVVKKFKE